MCELGNNNGHRLSGRYSLVICALQLAYPQGVLMSGQSSSVTPYA